MPHVPKAICASCLSEMTPMKNGVTIEMMTGQDGAEHGYYKVDSDMWGCRGCGAMIFIGFGTPTEHWEKDYAEIEVGTRARFASG